MRIEDAAARLEALISAQTAAPELAHGSSGEVYGASEEHAALECVSVLHGAFYDAASARGVNRFLEMEDVLVEAFRRAVVRTERAFWEFIVRVVLLLARKKEEGGAALAGASTAASASAGSDIAARSTKSGKKKSKKLSQPYAPLAFMTVNALKKLVEAEDRSAQRLYCQEQGRSNASLREFCVRGLRDTNYVDQKLLVEIMDLFTVTGVDNALVRHAASSLVSTRSFTALIKLLGIFSTVEWSFEIFVKSMAASKDWSSAELLVKTLDHSPSKALARVLVDEAIAAQEFKRAHNLVHKFSLQDVYPDIEHLYFRDGLMKLIEKHRWDIAISFAGSDNSLQRTVLESMVAAGEFFRAIQLANALRLEDFHISGESQSVHHGYSQFHGSTFAATVNGFLELELDCDSAVMFCSTEESVQFAFDFFFGGDRQRHTSTPDAANGSRALKAFSCDQLVGLDVEWKPASTKIAAATGSLTTSAVASILQIATATRVFVIDLLALHECSYLFDVFLLRLLNAPELLKVGFGFDTDMKVLHQTFPERLACRYAAPFLELSSVVLKFFGSSTGNSLSSATTTILGKPLDKTMQLSNWDNRPLAPDQLAYAALDAYCLVQIVDKLMHASHEATHEAALPVWSDIAAHIGSLTLASPLEKEDAEAAIKLRKKYYVKWIESRSTSTEHSPGFTRPNRLRGADEIKSYWDQRLQICGLESAAEGDQAAINTCLKFLPVADAHALLKQQAADGHPTVVAVNTICFFADERPSVACIDASCKLDTAQLASLIGVSRRKIKLATALECPAQFGFVPGTVPPFGHGASINTSSSSSSSDGASGSTSDTAIYADSSLLNAQHLLCGGGSADVLLLLESRAFFKVIDIEAVADIQRGFSAFSSTQSLETRSSVPGEHIASAPPPSERELKFLADSMVARVGKWLRTMGHDVIIWDPYAFPKKTEAQDHKAALLALATREQRILLTRDKKLASRRDAGACFVVSSDDPHEQFREVRTHFALRLVEAEMMSRCARCNAKGFDVVDADYVRTQQDDEVHPNVLAVVTDFWICRVCRKVYWEGPKFASSYQNVRRMFDDQGEATDHK